MLYVVIHEITVKDVYGCDFVLPIGTTLDSKDVWSEEKLFIVIALPDKFKTENPHEADYILEEEVYLSDENYNNVKIIQSTRGDFDDKTTS